MQYYYINKIKNDGRYNEIHISSCSRMPKEENREYLGYLISAREAYTIAFDRGYTPDGCGFCCPEIHIG